jgi:hypothetical protein
MMLNGLQNSSKTLLVDTAPAKLQSVDAETTEQVSFSELLKLKEKQLQHELEASASSLAVAFASLQTASSGPLLPFPAFETSNAASGDEISKIAAEPLSQPAAKPLGTSDLFSTPQTSLARPGMTDAKISSSTTADMPVSGNVSQQASIKTNEQDQLPQTLPGAVLPVANGVSSVQPPVQFNDPTFTSKLATSTSVERQVTSSATSTSLNNDSSRVTTTSAGDGQNSASTLENSTMVERQRPDLTVFNMQDVSRSAKTTNAVQESTANTSSVSSNFSETEQPGAGENTRANNLIADAVNPDLKSAPVKTFAEVHAQSLPVREEKTGPTIQQGVKAGVGQTSANPASTIPPSSSFTDETGDGIAQAENQIHDKSLSVREADSENSIEDAVREPVLFTAKQQISGFTEVGSDQAASLPSLSDEPADNEPAPMRRPVETLIQSSVPPIDTYAKDNSQHLVGYVDGGGIVDKHVSSIPTSVDSNMTSVPGKTGEVGDIEAFNHSELENFDAVQTPMKSSYMEDDKAIDLVATNSTTSEPSQEVISSKTSNNNSALDELSSALRHSDNAAANEKEPVQNTVNFSTKENTDEPSVIGQDVFPAANSRNDIEMIDNTFAASMENDGSITKLDASPNVPEDEPQESKKNIFTRMEKLSLSEKVDVDVVPHAETINEVDQDPFARMTFDGNDVVPNPGFTSSSRDIESFDQALNKAESMRPGSVSVSDPQEIEGPRGQATEDDFVGTTEQRQPGAGTAELQNRWESMDVRQVGSSIFAPDVKSPLINPVSTQSVSSSEQTNASLEKDSDAVVSSRKVTSSPIQQDPIQVERTVLEKKVTLAPETFEMASDSSKSSVELPLDELHVSVDKSGTSVISSGDNVKTGIDLQKFSEAVPSEIKNDSAEVWKPKTIQPETRTDDVVGRRVKIDVETQPARSMENGAKLSEEIDPEEMKLTPELSVVEATEGNQDIFEVSEAVTSNSRMNPVKVDRSEKDSSVETGEQIQPGQISSGVAPISDISKKDAKSANVNLLEKESGPLPEQETDPVLFAENQSARASQQTEATMSENPAFVSNDLNGLQASSSGKDVNISQANTMVSVKSDLSEKMVVENTNVQTAPMSAPFEPLPQTFGEVVTQSGLPQGAKTLSGDAAIHHELPADRPAKSVPESVPGNEVEPDSQLKSKAFDAPAMEPKAKLDANSIKSTDDPEPGISTVPVSTEFVYEPTESAQFKHQTVEEVESPGKVKSTVKEEKASPAEKQPKMNQAPDIAAPANSPVKEPMAVKSGGNIPLSQLHADLKEVVQQLVRNLNPNLKDGPTSMRLQLNPRELGAIDVQMVSDSHGVHVTFFAEQASTGKLLETQLDQLRGSLVDSGVHLSGLDIGQHNQFGQKGGSFEQGSNLTQDFSRDFPKAQTVRQENTGPEKSLGRTSDIDYLI